MKKEVETTQETVEISEQVTWKERINITPETRKAIAKAAKDTVATLALAIAANVIIDAGTKAVKNRFGKGELDTEDPTYRDVDNSENIEND